MRLLLVSDLDPVTVIGGGERLLAAHAAGLAERGHEIIVCSGAPATTTADAGGRVVRIGRSPATPRRAAAAVDAFAPDAVIGYQPACALGALRAARRRAIPTLYVFLSAWAEEHTTRRSRPTRAGTALRRATERACLRAADRVVALSAYSARALRAAHPGVSAAVHVAPAGVDTARFAPVGSRAAARRQLGWPAEDPLLLAVRNLVPRMGLDNLVSAVPAVLRSFPRARLVVVGDGPLRPDLEAQAARLGLEDRVVFAGFVPDRRLPGYYQAADLAVLPTRCLEGFGLSTVEALACGTPVVGTPVGATPEILAPLDPALLTRDATPEALAAGIVSFLRRGSSDLPERARRHVLAHYTREAATRRLEAVVCEVVA